jgi:hypothetical protein
MTFSDTIDNDIVFSLISNPARPLFLQKIFAHAAGA